ncbi:MAG: transporter substrate-binding domain-containing protein [Spirochaetales bacterium]|nr:transporter substrate-binding domain-containing protein [Spirochaetales bacterium]
MKKRLFSLLFLFHIPLILFASDIKVVRWGTEIWKGFTDEDGSGLYTQVLTRIFDLEEIELETHIYPFSRALHLTENGELDLAGGIPKNSKLGENCLQARYPIVVSRFSAFYNKKNTGPLRDVDSLRDKKIICTLSVGEMIGLKEDEYEVVTTRDQAINLVLIGRYDVYIDDEKVLQTTMETYEHQFNRNEYASPVVATKGWYMIATDSRRGREILDIFDRGMETLIKTGELITLYESLGFIPPAVIPE